MIGQFVIYGMEIQNYCKIEKNNVDVDVDVEYRISALSCGISS